MKVIFLLSLSALQATSFAQEKDISNFSIEDLLNVRVESSSFFKQQHSESPSTITVFTKKEIEQMGIKTLSELFAHIPSFSLLELGDRKTMTIRGSRSLAHMLLLVDGHRMNNTITGGPYILNNEILLSRAKQVEIIRGPGSAMYGANAFHAVINIITENKETSAGFRIGNYKQKEASASFNTSRNDFDINLFTEFYKDKDYSYSKYRDSVSSGTGSTITERENLHVKDSKKRIDTQLSISKNNFKSSFTYNEREYSGGSNEDGIAYSNDHNRTKISNTNLVLSYEKELDNSSFDTALILAESTFNPFGYKGTKNTYEYFTGSYLSERRAQLVSKYKRTFSDFHRIVGGLDLRMMKLHKDPVISNFDENDNYLGETKEVYSSFIDKTQKQVGLFFQTQNNFHNLLKLTTGLRFDHDSVSDSSISPRIAINSQITDTIYSRLSYGEAFRPPSYSELYQNIPTVKGNTSLEAEKVKIYEASLSRTTSRHKIEATYYISFLTKKIAGFINSGVINFRNNEKNRREGIEIEMHNFITDSLTLRTTLSRSFKLKQTDSLMPDHLGLASVIINYKYNDFNFNVRGVYKRKFKDLAQKDLYLFSSKVEYTYDDKTKIYLLGQNITNKEYLNTTFIRTKGHTNRGALYSIGINLAL